MTTDQSDLFDITFIGAGPVALYGMYYAGLRMTRYKAIDMRAEVGGGLTALYPEKYIYDVGGFPRILAKQLSSDLLAQATQYPHTLCLGETVQSIKRTDDNSFLIGTDRHVHRSRTIVVCIGMGAYTPKRPDLPSAIAYEGRGVSYWITSTAEFRGKHVLVVGGGDSAFDYSLMLQPVAASVTHIHRNDFFGAHEDSVRKVMASTIELKFPYWVVQELHGTERLEAVTLQQTKTGETDKRTIDAVIFCLGFQTDLGSLTDWGLTLEKGCIVVDSRMRTNVEGIFAAGDIVTYDGKLKLISTGFGEVAIAVNNAKVLIDPKAKVNPGHSTDKHELVMKKVGARSLLTTESPSPHKA